MPRETAVNVAVERLANDRRLGPQLAHRIYLPGQPAQTADADLELAPALVEGLGALGVVPLWSHQAAGLTAARRGDHVLVTTPTASGKSLIFQLPLLQERLEGGPGRALFLYPLKALGQDQKVHLDELSVAAGLDPSSEIYDGDTPSERRAQIRQEPPRVVISNPDMIHLSLLAYWASWETFLKELKWIVLDELHTYRGIFGSHFHHVLQRLFRLARRLGAEPRVIASSATAANAGEFASLLTGAEFEWIHESGAPREGRHVLLVQPATSAYTTTLQLLVSLLQSGLKVIVFTKARRITELLYKWLLRQSPELGSRVACYRSGFLPEERRQIEQELFAGRLQGVISTSALEMGIDVGGLDACILVGYPGSVMATWQRSGRAGRRGQESLTALVALPDALDQYLLRHPEELVGRPLERLVVDPHNELVSRAHLVCAAAEEPLREAEDGRYLDDHRELVTGLLEGGDLIEVEGKETGVYQSREGRPHRGVSLRGGGGSFSIVDESSGRTVGTVDGIRVQRECHPGAIYLHGGRQFQIHELRTAEKRVVAEPLDVDYFTSALGEKRTRILEVLEERHVGPLSAWLGRLRVTERVVGYERKRIFGQERLDQHPLDLPPSRFETVGVWWVLKPEQEEVLRGRDHHVMGSLHAAEHATISLFPLVALCDRGDIGGISIPFHPQVGGGAVFVYDGHAGGVGIARRGFAGLEELLARVGRLLAACECEDGCPSCVHSPKCGNGNRPLDKAGAHLWTQLLLAETAGEPPSPWPLDLEAVVEDELAPEPAADPPPEAVTETEKERDFGPPPGPESDPEIVGRRRRRRSARRRRGRELHRLITGWRDRTVLFDLETRRSAADVGGWHRIHRMGVAIGVVCYLEESRLETFQEDRVPELIEALRQAELVVGFNVKRFDFRVLAGYTGADYGKLFPTLDLLEDIVESGGGRRSLQNLASATLGAGKSADGLQSLQWVRQGRLDRVEEYCRRDVEVMRDLYLFGRREGYVRCLGKEDRVMKLRVDW